MPWSAASTLNSVYAGLSLAIAREVLRQDQLTVLAMTDDERTLLTRRIRYHLGRAEDGVAIAATALTRVRELQALDFTTREEIASDIELLRGKLDTLRNLLAL